MTANLLEYGSKHQPATPWLRPAAQENAQRIVTTVNADLVRRVERLVTKLARQKGVPK
jgi:membrane carboxypeptidase/penicillin-binding protein PbpC